MQSTIASALSVCCECRHLRAIGGIALIVGTWLTIVNQVDVLLASGVDAKLLLKIDQLSDAVRGLESRPACEETMTAVFVLD
jgi:hypothetical protein